ncbi:MAG: 30S ribosomal protein S6 [Candidatus Portnoybacteria bacterium RBG_19FT_COMBO_36_7]|uniref:Small ribosomal subunit protein bS6 n=1 Tax=Candidatus Portnoybacteria bacterium RBG_19FT_COMBO_36_7 TaxID=1801992 RepID=A0A1G2F9H5_9BACT|nr:MAG: 30S ribosomal protein S6 [Candidatus Portnoybacteria bacterium RBG_19FT_COMBO_36_7]
MYELTYIIISNFPDQEVIAQTDKVRSFINDLGGEIKNEKLGEKRRLAYPIKKQGYGFYVTVEFNIDPEKVIELDKKIRLQSNILRHLLINKDEIKETPRRISIPRPPKEKIGIGARPESETPEEKVKIEELDKKLEEILEE